MISRDDATRRDRRLTGVFDPPLFGCSFVADFRPEGGRQGPWADYLLLKPDVPDTETQIKNSWAVPTGDTSIVVPAEENIVRVTGKATQSKYLTGGATHAYRMVSVLEEAMGRKVDPDWTAIDWGCGAARLTQHLDRIFRSVIGVDVDPTNIAWCRENLPALHVELIPWTLPTGLDGEVADVVFAFSVFSHIRHDRQRDWLAALKDTLRPGGYAVVTTLGVTSTRSRNAKADFYEKLFKGGFVEWPNKAQLDDVRGEEDNYLNIAMTQTYAQSLFSDVMDVVSFVPGAGPQDFWVLRRRS